MWDTVKGLRLTRRTALAGALTGGQLDPGAFRTAVERVTALRTSLS